MINRKFFMASRIAAGLVFAAGLAGIVYYQQNKNSPEMIEKIEMFKTSFIYGKDQNGLFDQKAVEGIAESLRSIFSPPRLEFDAVLEDISAGTDPRIIFSYRFTSTPSESITAGELKERQKNRFCRSGQDLQRLEHLNGYTFNYHSARDLMFSFSISAQDCSSKQFAGCYTSDSSGFIFIFKTYKNTPAGLFNLRGYYSTDLQSGLFLPDLRLPSGTSVFI